MTRAVLVAAAVTVAAVAATLATIALLADRYVQGKTRRIPWDTFERVR